MRIEALWRAPGASIVGTGLIALDVVLNERHQRPPKLWTGGTCGNVIIILASLGWHSYPVARLEHDIPARLIRKDLRRWNVDLHFLSSGPLAPTPIIVHRLRRNTHGENFHTFSVTCPECGQRLPMFRPVDRTTVNNISWLPKANVFFTDRASAGILALAERCRHDGAVVVFEPSAIGDEAMFRRMLGLTDILKYSHERLPDLHFHTPREILLEVQTLGPGGLRFRSAANRLPRNRWVQVGAFPVEQFRDTAGAGDWCTAGLLHALASRGLAGLKSATIKKIVDASAFAQALAAWNCGFEGARGGMYECSVEDFRSSLEQILETKSHKIVTLDEDFGQPPMLVSKICSSCRSKMSRSRLVRQLHNAG
jgi:sugar/nucleoside kinase (ribokinase family)